jgi:hypothetical protein
LGLEILKVGSKENLPPVSISTTTPLSTPKPKKRMDDKVLIGIGGGYEYQPHSTARAKQRADFEAQRVLNEKVRLKEEAEQRRQQVKTLRKELKKLGTSI